MKSVRLSVFLEYDIWTETKSNNSQADLALTLDFSRPQDYNSGFAALAKLQHLQDKLLPLTSRFQSSMGTISGLEQFYAFLHSSLLDSGLKFKTTSAELESLRFTLEGHLLSIESLKSRSQGILKLVRVCLRNALNINFGTDNIYSSFQSL